MAGDTFNIILADPPWQYRDKASSGKRGAVHKYDVMSVEDIAALPVSKLAADNCVLFMWITYPFLEDGFKVIREWGFTYKTVAFTWVKRNKVSPTWFFGMGNWTRSNAEICLLAVKGKPKRASASVYQIIDAPIGKHSEKPAIVRDRIVELCGDLPRVELFARQSPPGWECIGNGIDGRDIREVLKEW